MCMHTGIPYMLSLVHAIKLIATSQYKMASFLAVRNGLKELLSTEAGHALFIETLHYLQPATVLLLYCCIVLQ